MLYISLFILFFILMYWFAHFEQSRIAHFEHFHLLILSITFV